MAIIVDTYIPVKRRLGNSGETLFQQFVNWFQDWKFKNLQFAGRNPFDRDGTIIKLGGDPEGTLNQT